MRHPEHILKLIRLYSKAQETLVKIIAEHEARGTLTMYQESLLEQVERELERIRLQSMEWSQQTIPDKYMQGITEVAAALAEQYGIEVPGYNAFSRLHTRAIDLLVRNTTEDLIDATNFIGRQIRDNVRQAGLETIAQKVATGSTVRQAKLNLVNSLVDQGLNGIRDKRGRMISLDAYASTVARSTTREATNTATINHLKALDYDLVKMSSHATTCPVCAVLQGRVYSLTGRTPGYPVLTRAFGSHANIHPNCRHVLTPYIPELQDDAEADRLFSNRPFDIDPRSQKEIDRYNKQQREKAKLRNDRNQYQRYQLALGKDAPKSFAGFRAMKKADSDRWRELQKDYRDANRQIKDPFSSPNNESIRTFGSYINGADLNDRRALAQTLLKKAGLDHIPVSIRSNIGANGFCEIDFNSDTATVSSLVLSKNDGRSVEYQTKTALHEYYHANMHGSKHDFHDLGQTEWLKYEETATETAAHYMLDVAGVKKDIAYSYSKNLVEVLPKLKRMDEFKDANTVKDFGKEFMKYRFDPNHKSASWQTLKEKSDKIDIDMDDYIQQYESFVFSNEDHIASMIYDNVSDGNKHSNKSAYLQAIKRSMNDGWRHYDYSSPGFTDSLAIAMNALGVK